MNTIAQNEVQITVSPVTTVSAFVVFYGVQIRRVFHIISVLLRIDLYACHYLFCSRLYSRVRLLTKWPLFVHVYEVYAKRQG